MRARSEYERFHRATGLIRSERMTREAWATPPETSSGCSICGRAWNQVEDPTLCGTYQYNTSMACEYECTTCHTVRMAAPTTLGIEQYRGKDKVPSGGRLGMLPGCGGVITADDELYLALNKGFYDKFANGTLGQAGALGVTRSLDLFLDLLGQGRLGNLSDGVIFVQEWGRKPDVLMSNLMLTYSLSEVWACSEKGAECMDLLALIETARWLHDNDLGDKASRPAFWKPVREAAAGKHDSAALASWASKIPEPQALLDRLPVDPRSRMSLPATMAMLVPRIAGGSL